jgi:hypothetical protein
LGAGHNIRDVGALGMGVEAELDSSSTWAWTSGRAQKLGMEDGEPHWMRCQGSTERRELRTAPWLRRMNYAWTSLAESRGGSWWLSWEKEEVKGGDQKETAPMAMALK